jgi:agmatine deiminase
MILDCNSNFVWVADTLFTNYPQLSRTLEQTFVRNSIPWGKLPGTRDVWCRDFMPIQVSQNNFVQFHYDPDYLRPKKYHSLRTDPELVRRQIGIDAKIVDVILDGGNVVKGNSWVIVTDKIFSENPRFSPSKLIGYLEDLLETRIVVIPRDPYDYTGHADGMVRYLNDNVVLLNRYLHKDVDFGRKVRAVLGQKGMEVIEVPYNPYRNRSSGDATGIYINFLETQQMIVLPKFGLPEDEEFHMLINDLYPAKVIEVLNCNEIAVNGGILNCVTWPIRRQ